MKIQLEMERLPTYRVAITQMSNGKYRWRLLCAAGSCPAQGTSKTLMLAREAAKLEKHRLKGLV